MLRMGLLLIALLCAAPSAPAAAEGDEGGGEHASEHEHHGPLHFSDIFRKENTTFWAAIINFSLLVYLLRRYGKKPLQEFLVKRRAEMEQAMAEAAAAKQKAEAKYNEYNERLRTLDRELEKLRTDIERAAQEDKQRIMADAEEAARRLRRETESLIDQHAKALGASVRHEMVDAAVSAAEKLLRDKLTETDQQRLLQEFNQQLHAEPTGASARPAQPSRRPPLEGQP
jgi:F-type H+-transporting ATPase subunit b